MEEVFDFIPPATTSESIVGPRWMTNKWNGPILLRKFCFQEEREAREMVKREQDEAYQASLLQDRAKVAFKYLQFL